MQTSTGFIGLSSFAVGLPQLLRRLGPCNATVMINGETGTGKSIIAQATHSFSNRTGPLVVFDCATTPEPLFESELYGSRKGAFTGATDNKGMICQANFGTLWLEEIGELSLPCQAKLLRMLDGKYRPIGARTDLDLKARVIATTNRDLGKMVEKHEFREDLFYRLQILQIVIPPLRERPEDIVPILSHYLRTCDPLRGEIGLEIREESLTYLQRYSWPGNIRELESSAKRALFQLADGEQLSTDHIVRAVGGVQAKPQKIEVADSGPYVVRTLPSAIAEVEKRMIREALDRNNGNVQRSARELGISRHTVDQKAARYGLPQKKYQAAAG